MQGLDKEVAWIRANFDLMYAKRQYYAQDPRWWVPAFYKHWQVQRLTDKLNNLSFIINEIIPQIEHLTVSIEQKEQEILAQEAEIAELQNEIQQLEQLAREMFVGRKRQGAIKRGGGGDSASTHSFMMFGVVVVVVCLTAVFLYASPFFEKDTADRPPSELNKPAEVVVLSPAESTKENNYDFYQVLSERKIESVDTNLSQPQEEVVGEVKVDKVVQVSEETNDEITLVETDETYDEPETPSDAERVHISRSNSEYFLQMKSYDNASDADKRRSEVLLAGVDAQVEIRELDDGTTAYVVVSAPFANEEVAGVAYERLKASGIDALIVKKERKTSE